MLFAASDNALQQWLMRYRNHADWPYLNIQCQDAQGLFWHKRHLYQQTPKRPLQGRFVKHLAWQDIERISVERVDGKLPQPIWLYPQPLLYGLVFLVVFLLFMLAMSYFLPLVMHSLDNLLYPFLLSLIVFNVHKELLHTILRTFGIRFSWLMLPRYLHWLLRLVILVLLFVWAALPLADYFQTLNEGDFKVIFRYALGYLIGINAIDFVLNRRLRSQKPDLSEHFFALRLHLNGGRWIDFAHARDSNLLQALQRHLHKQHPHLQDASDEIG